MNKHFRKLFENETKYQKRIAQFKRLKGEDGWNNLAENFQTELSVIYHNHEVRIEKIMADTDCTLTEAENHFSKKFNDELNKVKGYADKMMVDAIKEAGEELEK